MYDGKYFSGIKHKPFQNSEKYKVPMRKFQHILAYAKEKINKHLKVRKGQVSATNRKETLLQRAHFPIQVTFMNFIELYSNM